MIYQMYIDGKWCESEGGAFQNVVNPATGQSIGKIPLGTRKDADRAVDAAFRIAPKLEQIHVFDRAQMCVRIADAMDKRATEFANLITMEHGKRIVEARLEVAASIRAFREMAEQIKWLDNVIPNVRIPNRRAFVLRKPLGVFAAITPWNFPLGSACQNYLAAGVATGNALVWNPSTTTAAIASFLMKCIEEADLPAGAVNLVIGAGSVVGDALVVNPRTAGVGFTGSTAVGNTICERAKAKHTSMELGGNGPSIVLKDADLDLAAAAVMRGAFTNAGQICTSTERVLVDESVADQLAAKIMERIDNHKVGDPASESTTMGIMHKMQTVNTVREHVADALAKGATLLSGGKVLNGAPTENYFEATVLDHVSRDSLLNCEETFGPVLPLIRYQSEAQIPEIIADSPYRLFCAIFSRNLDKAFRMAENSKFGAITINTGSNSWDGCFPAGGGAGSASGHGRSGGKWSIYDMTEERVVTVLLSEHDNE